MPRAPSPPPLEVLYEDNHCLAVIKPSRLLIAGDETGDPHLLDQAREYLKHKYDKPGNVFVGLVHRLDRPVSGIVLFARTSKAASRLSEQFRTRTISKRYLALVSGRLAEIQGTCRSWLIKDEKTNLVKIVPPKTPEAREAILHWHTLEQAPPNTLLRIDLETGRSHQIRVQLAELGFPICGDVKYGSPIRCGGAIALHASELTFRHPTTKEEIRLESPPPAWWNAHRR